MPEAEAVEVVHNADDERFEIALDGEVGYLTYSRSDGRLFLLHTEVPAAFEGRGYGGELVRSAFEYARRERLPVVIFCPFARTYLKRHPEYADLVETRA